MVNLLYRHRVATVITDTAGRRDALHLSLTQPAVLVRFQGNDGHPTDAERLAHWADRLKIWRQGNLEEVYFFAHQPGGNWIPQTAREAQRLLTGNVRETATDTRGQLELGGL